MICRACLRARALAADALPAQRLLRPTQVTQRQSLSTAAPRPQSTLANSRLSRTQLLQMPARHRLFSTSTSVASAAPQPQEPAPASTGAPEKPTYLSDGESQVWDILMAEFAPTQLVVQDISGGCGSMYGIEVSSDKFRGLPMLKQQRLVNAALGDLMKEWHGVQLKTRAILPARSTSNTSQPPITTTPTMAPRSPARAAIPGWSHTPSTPTLLWLAVSLPLVAWDTAYMLLRPHTMPGGALHRPLWVPYALYGEVDHMYGFKQWDLRNPFAAAQSLMNLAETLLYLAYLGLWYVYGTRAGTGTAAARRAVGGRVGALAVLVGFSAAVMTVSKTVLYWVLEYCSGFDNIGQNDFWTLFVLWIIPNGAWIVAPSIFMIFGMGSEIITGLSQASAPAKKLQ
ncbi:hypothetical protein C8A01DRAFT_45494 [Parachaetomium inaequale]|uniref:Uncharacterized protein n=1 Tax=Parachaetomium inaequale TaxID=2588326 RepID=A0AAN6SSD3_9PEZI|nr:hypothetical protein C8A01DRAFT_45494 [Parachaetomium inaequale]